MQTDPTEAAVKKRMGRGPRWLLRLAALVACVIVALVAWSVLERRGLNNRIDALRKAGEPVTPADLNSAPVPDEQNAVIELSAAARIIDQKADTWKGADQLYSLRLPFSEADLKILRDGVTPNAAALPLVEAATRKSGVGWDLKFQSPMLLEKMPELSEQRKLANLLRYAALIAHQQGDDATAMRHMSELLFVSRAVDHYPTIIGHLVATGISAVASDLAGDIAPDLRIGENPPAASAAQVRDVIRQFLDENERRAGLIRAFEGDRVMAADS